MPKREQPGVVKAWAVSDYEESLAHYATVSVSCWNRPSAWATRTILLVDPRKNDVVPKRPRPAKKKAKKKSPSHDEGPPFGFLVPSSETTKKKRSRK